MSTQLTVVVLKWDTGTSAATIIGLASLSDLWTSPHVSVNASINSQVLALVVLEGNERDNVTELVDNGSDGSVN